MSTVLLWNCGENSKKIDSILICFEYKMKKQVKS